MFSPRAHIKPIHSQFDFTCRVCLFLPQAVRNLFPFIQLRLPARTSAVPPSRAAAGGLAASDIHPAALAASAAADPVSAAAEAAASSQVWAPLCERVLTADTSSETAFNVLPKQLKAILKEAAVPLDPHKAEKAATAAAAVSTAQNSDDGEDDDTSAGSGEDDDDDNDVFKAERGQSYLPAMFQVTLNAQAYRTGKLLGEYYFTQPLVSYAFISAILRCLLAEESLQLTLCR